MPAVFSSYLVWTVIGEIKNQFSRQYKIFRSFAHSFVRRTIVGLYALVRVDLLSQFVVRHCE
ncbi:hypothetical protein ACM0A7_24240 [Mycobacteroides abscessus subsp. massiliense]|uniref:hypothetical protein n=1 Tax=Mycobacteroides abscessus TaxID=36809 RepID=UPI0019D07502|nr:hypothetical protein [Mycobacteroides abscessus]MBN7567096.1 hypothetical protein [Mycobacteroides abscessus subsp. massiliense]